LCLAALLLPLEAGAEVAVIDDRGRELRLDGPAERVIALYGAYNEMLAAMGREKVIVARTRADRMPESILELPCIGTHMRPNIEMVAGLEPDLVLQMGGRSEASEPLTALERLGVATAHFRARNFRELFSVIRRLGVLVGARQEAEKLVAGMNDRLVKLRERVSGRHAPTVFFEVRYPNLLAAGQGSIVNQVIEAAGGENCVRLPDKLARLSEEELIRLDPEAYLVQVGPMNESPAPPAERGHFRTIKAVKNGRVLMVDEKLFSRPGPRSVLAAEILAAFLHPERFVHSGGKEGQ
jgi:iron complex transport system substrate-binding protein